MSPVNDTEALSILAATPLLGSIKIRLLIHYFGSATQALNASAEEVKELPGFGAKITSRWGWWHTNDSWKRNLDLAARMHVSLIPYHSSDYPKPLLKIPDYPVLLYVKGNIQNSDSNGIAIVGTRNATLYGKQQAASLAADLARAGNAVISGLARGIDTCAHHAAIKTGRTIAVIGSGLANIYPTENKELAEQITDNGALISEYPMLTPPDRQHFPQRNRIVSGLSLGTLLIEAPIRSGAMITMRYAKEHGRKRWVIPGRCDVANFQGNHELIKGGEAQLVENASDILSCFGSLFSFQPCKAVVEKTLPKLEHEEIRLLQHLPCEEVNIDQIAELTKLPIMKLNVLLMSLVMKQMLQEHPGKVYQKTVSRKQIGV